MAELIQNFGLDWRLLLAQAVNFFILLFLLKRFAYGPILNALKTRKTKIEEGIRFGKEAEKRLGEIDILREEKLQEARQDALKLVSGAEETAKKKKAEIVAEAQRKVEGVIADAKRTIAQERAKMDEELYKDAEEGVRAGIGKVLGELPSEVRDRNLIQKALRELKTIRS